MATTTSLYKGKEEYTMVGYEALQTIDSDIDYTITNYPNGGITNTDMVYALTCTRLFQEGESFVCLDNGTYAQGHIYKIKVENNIKAWEDITSSGSVVTVSDTGTSTDEVQYITIDGVEKKLAGGGGGSMKIKLAGVAQTPDEQGYVNVPIGGSDLGLFKVWNLRGIYADNGLLYLSGANDTELINRYYNYAVRTGDYDKAVKLAMTAPEADSEHTDKTRFPATGTQENIYRTAWTDEEKQRAWARQTIIKTSIDSVLVANAQYYLGEQSSLNLTMPTTATVGQTITVCFSSGATACTLTCDLTGFDFVPKANKTNKIVFTLIDATAGSEKWLVETEEG